MQKFTGIVLALVILTACGKQDAAQPSKSYDFSKDAYTWLEEVETSELWQAKDE